MLERLGHGLVLGGAVEQLAADGLAGLTALAQRMQGREHGRLYAFGGAADEQQLAAAVSSRRWARARTPSIKARALSPVLCTLLGLP